MRGSDFEELLSSLADGWTRRDYATVTSHFADDVLYSDPLNYTIRDNESLLVFFRDDDGKPQSCVFHNSVFDEQRQLGAAEYTYEGTFRYHGTVWIELKEDKITSWREYQHKTGEDWTEFWKK